MSWFYVWFAFFILPGVAASLIPFTLQLAVGIATENKKLRAIPTVLTGLIFGMNGILFLTGARTYYMMGFGYIPFSDQALFLCITPFVIIALAAAWGLTGSARDLVVNAKQLVGDLFSGGAKKIVLRLLLIGLSVVLLVGGFYAANLLSSGRFNLQYISIQEADIGSVQITGSDSKLTITDPEQIKNIVNKTGRFGLALGQPLQYCDVEFASAEKCWVVFYASDGSELFTLGSLGDGTYLIGGYCYENLDDGTPHQYLLDLMP